MKAAYIILLLSIGPVAVLAQHDKMARIPGGDFKPFLLSGDRRQTIKVRSFYLDVHAVTNEEFLGFVKTNPEWRRSKVARLFADSHYLTQWAGDLDIGDARMAKSPVTNISWFAANAYCRWKGKRLPTMSEWEYAAGAAPVHYKGGRTLTKVILEWYDHPTPVVLPAVESTYKNAFGLYDMHGLVWEWVEDFNGEFTSGDSRGDNSQDETAFCGGGVVNINDRARTEYSAFMRYAFRGSLKGNYTVDNLGFRCAKNI